jgi:hypothetical protein
MLIDSLFVAKVIHAVLPNIDNVWLGLIVLVIMYVINNFIFKKKHVIAGFKLGVVTGAETTVQELQKTNLEGYEKARNVETAFNKTLKSDKIPAIDTKVEKAAKSMGGIKSVISDAIGILNLVLPLVFKKK